MQKGLLRVLSIENTLDKISEEGGGEGRGGGPGREMTQTMYAHENK
jgi:hypothetical protein